MFTCPEGRLSYVRCDEVEEYLIKRVKEELGPALCKRVAPNLGSEQIEQAISDVLQGLLVPSLPVALCRDYHLLLHHECLGVGCRDQECRLCQYNPVRLCDRPFGKKYLVGDALKATCGADVKIQLVDGRGQEVDQDVPGVQYEIVLLDGVIYKEKGGEGHTLTDDDLEECLKRYNSKVCYTSFCVYHLLCRDLQSQPAQDEALLQHKNGGNHQHGIRLKPEKGIATLPELQVTDSSEALLTGRRPPFRMLVRAVDQDGKPHPGIAYVCSEEFVVATRRVKQANKAEIPLLDDHVGKIEHIGKETIRKLQDFAAWCDVPGAPASITTVRQLSLLVDLADKDGQLRKRLQSILKLSKEKWEEAACHTMQAVEIDSRRRIWYPPGQAALALLFSAKQGAVALRGPVDLVRLDPQGLPMVLKPCELNPYSLDMLRQLKAQAALAWWLPHHLGWGIYAEDEIEGAPPSSWHLHAALSGHKCSAGPATGAHKRSRPLERGPDGSSQMDD